MIAILPYMEQNALYNRYDNHYTNDSPQNQAVRETKVAAYVCPSDEATGVLAVPATGPASAAGAKYAPGSYRAVTGRSEGRRRFLDSEMMFDYKREWRGPIHAAYTSFAWGFGVEKPSDITDGTSHTLTWSANRRPRPRPRGGPSGPIRSPTTRIGGRAQQRTLLADYDACVNTGGIGDDIPCKREWGSFHPAGMNFVLCDGASV